MEVGDVLQDRYQLQSVLGIGGMGTVYKAVHLGLNRPVAIKLLHPHIVSDERAVQRFHVEMQAMSALNHPHLISITDADLTKSGSPFLVMEYLDGVTLERRLMNGSLAPDETIQITVEIAEALAYAHDKGIVHRDLKPGNIMLVGPESFVKVVDLGIAKLLNTEDGASQKLTQTGEVFGSPLYMSPEQCLGKPIDGRSDIYSLGCIIFEMLTGSLPIRGSSPFETLLKHTNEPPRTLSTLRSITMTPTLMKLDEVIARCLEKDPNLRIQSMRELAAILKPLGKAAVGSGTNTVSPTAITPRLETVSEVAPNDGQSKTVPTYIKDSATVPPIQTVNLSIPSNTPAVPPTVAPGVEAADVANSPPPAPKGTRRWRQFNSKLTAGSLVIVLAIVIVSLSSWFGRHAATTRVPGIAPEPSPSAQVSDGVVIDDDRSANHIYLVSEYEGTGATGFGGQTPSWGHTQVTVNDYRKPVILVLTAYNPVIWHVRNGNANVRIVKIIASGKMPMKVQAPSQVAVESAWSRYFDAEAHPTRTANYQPFKYFFLGSFTDVKSLAEWPAVHASIEQLAGGPVYKFYGRWRGDSFTIE